jgi:hypothetical protein
MINSYEVLSDFTGDIRLLVIADSDDIPESAE